MAPTRSEVDHWIRQDPETPRFLMGDDAIAFKTIRKQILKRLVRHPEMWWRQLLNIFGGCCRYLTLLIVGTPTLHFWGSLMPDLKGEGIALPLEPDWLEKMPTGSAPSFLSSIVLILFLLLLIDLVIWGGGIGGFRNVFSRRAERIAWHVWDEKHKESD